MCSWPAGLAACGAAFVALGLVQPWTWRHATARLDTSRASVAIIIPVLNEADGILDTLEALAALQPQPDEVIVVDGGSSDDTVQLARRSGRASRVLCSAKGRAVQMNAGADDASSELLCFLHADTRPPRDLVAVMRRELADPHTVLAGFLPSIEVPGRRLWGLTLHNAASTWYAPLLFRPLAFLRGLRALFGDQTMFCRRAEFQRVGGFNPQLVIMEDIDLCCRMHDAGPTLLQPRPAQRPLAGTKAQSPLASWWHAWRQPRGRVRQVLDRVSVTSGRRLAAWGALRGTLIHLRISTAWYFGWASPEQLRELYARLYTDAFR